MLRRRLIVSLVATGALVVAATPARASVADEQQAGRALAQQVRSGQRSCDSLSADDRDHIGEFVMGRMIGSTATHEAMNARMTAVMGAGAESQMHQVLGARWVGCATADGGNQAHGPMMGGAGGLSWMTGSRWQHMSTSDWKVVQHRMLGTTMPHHGGGGLSMLDVVLIALAAALGAGLLWLLLARRPRRGSHG